MSLSIQHLGRAFNYIGRAAKVWDVAVIGEGSKVLEEAYAKGLKGHRNIFTKDFYSNFWETTKSAGKELEAYKVAEVAKHGSAWKVLCNNFRNIPKQFAEGWKTSGIKGALKLGGKSIGRVLGPVMIVGLEIPNIFRAFKDGGLATGAIETGKAAARIGGFTAGAAIGQALIPVPILGGLIGGILGDVLMSKVLGKSFTEKQEIAKAAAQQGQQGQQGQQVPFTGVQENQQASATNPFQQQQQNNLLMQQMMAQNSFSDDFMLNACGGKVNLMV